MFLVFILLSSYLGWRLTRSLRVLLDDGPNSPGGLTTALCSVPMAWCCGYTACLTAAWIGLQSCALFLNIEPDVKTLAWLSLGLLLCGSLCCGKLRREHPVRNAGRLTLPCVWLLLFIWLVSIGGTFGLCQTDSGLMSAPQNLIRDLYSHTALIRSFSSGYNFPTQYPFFSGEPVRYHFLFYFGGGVLEALGAPLSIALNLPSALAFGSLLSLVSFAAWRLSRSLGAAWIALLLCLFRSSLSWMDWIAAVSRSLVEHNPALRGDFFYGNTPYEDWGIFSLNVHLNQRHLIHGFSWMLIVVIAILFSPPLRSPVCSRRSIPYVVIGVLLGCGAYWNGAAFLATMLILLPLTCVSEYRAKACSVALSAVLSSSLVVSLVTHGSLGKTPFEPVVRFGFLSPSSSPLSVLNYALCIFGVLPVVALVAAWRFGSRARILWWCGLMPIAFIFAVQVTQFAPQGHKFITAGTIIWSILSAGFLALLLASSRRRIRVSGQCIVVVMTLSGVLDACALLKLGATRLSYAVESSSIDWIRRNTPQDALFLLASRGDQAPLLAGRRVYIGPMSLSSEAGYSYVERVGWLQAVSSLEPAAQLVALRQKGITHIATEECRDMEGLISDPCPAHPEMAALVGNPSLQKLFSSSEIEILGVPRQ